MARIAFTLNGKPASLEVEGNRRLLPVIRDELGLTGTKYGCGAGSCGACTVLINDRAVRSCRYMARNLRNKHLVTIEGLADNGRLHPVQQAFVDHDALQCGYCIPGMILNACALLLRNPVPDKREIDREMERNLCRCGAHPRIVRAIQSAAQNMKGAA